MARPSIPHFPLFDIVDESETKEEKNNYEDGMKKNHKIRKEKRKFIGYRINKTATLRMLPDIFWTPF